MPTVQIDPCLAMFYEDTCFADPWQTHETAVLIHGIAESSRAGKHSIRSSCRPFGRKPQSPYSNGWCLFFRGGLFFLEFRFRVS
jgi:hypothetical protein